MVLDQKEQYLDCDSPKPCCAGTAPSPGCQHCEVQFDGDSDVPAMNMSGIEI